MIKGGIYRYLASLVLMLYVSVSFSADIISITCSCHHHHASNHSHHALQFDTHEAVAHHHAACCGDNLREDCCCGHEHSTEVSLYLQPRIDDGGQVKLYQLLSVVTDIYDYRCEHSESGQNLYGELILPQLTESFGATKPLRAPPVLV